MQTFEGAHPGKSGGCQIPSTFSPWDGSPGRSGFHIFEGIWKLNILMHQVFDSSLNKGKELREKSSPRLKSNFPGFREKEEEILKGSRGVRIFLQP